jgi:replicative DNA helicase
MAQSARRSEGSADALRLPPHSIEAEQAVLGGLMLDNESFLQVAELLNEEDFYRHDHRLIFRAVSALANDGKPYDVVTVGEWLEANTLLDEGGGLAYLAALAQNTPSAANIRAYAEIVRERSVLRQLIRTGTDIASSAYNTEGRSGEELLDGAERAIFSIAESHARTHRTTRPIKELLVEALDRIDHLFQRDNPITGVATGFADFDDLTSGLQASDLVVVAGRPSMGKAQPLDAKVRTVGGWRSMGELGVGDRLASIDGAASVVTGVFPQGRRRVYRVRFSDGRSAECCAEHLWCVRYRQWSEPRILRTDRLVAMLTRQRYRGRLWIDYHAGVFGHDEPLPVDPWLLGALLGGGTLQETTLRFSTASAAMIERMRACAGREMAGAQAGAYDYRIVRQVRGRVAGLAGSQPNGIRHALRRLGLWGCSSDHKFVPRLYLEARREVRLDVLRGLLDSDGRVGRWGSIRLATASAQLAQDVAELVRSLGGWCSIGVKQPRFSDRDGVRTPGKPAWVCHIAHPEPRTLFLLSEKQLRLPERWRRAKRLVIEAIESTREAPCQCISVSHPSRLYITDQDVVTHNTAFAVNIAEHAAIKDQLSVAIFSMEMPAAQLAMRMMASLGRIDQHKIRTGRLSDDDWPRLTSAVGMLSEVKLFIDDTPALTPGELRSRCRRLKREHGLDMVIIDYLQLMQVPGTKENRATEISEISRGLKALAKELNVPVVALSQLNRSLEQRPNKRPQMSDLRESGAIEQDADVIVFIYRDELYDPDSPDKGVAEIIVAKQRNGPVGHVKLAFRGQFTRFENLASDAYVAAAGDFG